MKFQHHSVLFVAAALAACGSSNAPAPAAKINGVFLDAATAGLEYNAGTAPRALTNAAGEFSCVPGETVVFSIGSITLGTAPCAAVITPLQLAGATDPRDARVMHRLLALQLLDEDNDPANGISINAGVRTALAARGLDFAASPAAFDTALKAVLAAAGAPYASRGIDDTRRMLAREHFEDTLASAAGAPVRENFTQAGVTGNVLRYQVRMPAAQNVPYEGNIAAVRNDFPQGFLASFGSGLAFKGVAANGDLEFYGLTDRGPNGDGPNVPVPGTSGLVAAKIFPAPSFVPSFGVITVGKGGAALASATGLKVASGQPASGLPLAVGTLGYSAEVPVLDLMKYDSTSKAVFNANGIDTEAIAVDKKRNVLWISDEYGPFLIKVDAATGVIQAKYAPGSGLPAIFAKRRANRGMEGMTYDAATDKVHGFLQSPLSDGSAPYAVTGKNEQVERFARFTRWVEFDPVTGQAARMFAYPVNGADYKDGRTGNAKLGDMVALGNGKFIVIEQGSGTDGNVFNRLMLVDTAGATDIQAAAFNPASSDLEKSSMAGAAVNGADWSKVVALKKTLLLDLNALGWLAEKAEGLAMVDANTLALVNDNDFGLATRLLGADGAAVADADVTKCNMDAAGVIVTSKEPGCSAGNSIRVGRGSDRERPSRLWLIKFDKALSAF